MLKINPSKETKHITSFIRQTLKREGSKRLVLGLSGGVDSSTCAFLAVKALGPKNLYILLTPYKNQDMSLAKKVIQKLKIPSENVIEIDITSHVNNFINEASPSTQGSRGFGFVSASFLPASPASTKAGGIRRRENKLNTSFSKFTPATHDRGSIRLTKKVKSLSKSPKYLILNTKYFLLKGNIIARVRMIITFDAAKKLNALVCGTENRSEYLLGYFTRFGDEASDIEPIRHLYKTQVYQLAKYLGVPKEIVEAEPTAGLWPGQTDEEELGFSYAQAETVLSLLFDKKMKIEDIKIRSGMPAVKVKKIIERVKNNIFKHKTPYHL